MELRELQETFSIPGVLAFAQHGELVRAEVHTAAAEATVYLQGAHLTHWQPAGQRPVLFLSERSEFVPSKAIRGGVPISFPWFAARSDGRPGPSHGFARTQPWEPAFAAMVGDTLHLTLTLGPTEQSRAFGYDHFRLMYELAIGTELRLRLTVVNEGAAPLQFEEAMHTYFAVGDVREAAVLGLEGTAYLDKVRGGAETPAAGVPLVLDGATDRVYETEVDCVIDDRTGARAIANRKTNSKTTVVWNPWKAMADLGEDEWPRMLCVETANTGADAVTIGPREAHTMETRISVASAGGEER